MKRMISTIFCLALLSPACVASSLDANLSQHHWEKRQLLVFTPNEKHPKIQPLKSLSENINYEIADRNLIIWLIDHQNGVTLDGEPQTQLTADTFQNRFSVKPTEFRVLLLGYDGDEKQSSTSINLEDIFSTIDQMPIRQMEMQGK